MGAHVSIDFAHGTIVKDVEDSSKYSYIEEYIPDQYSDWTKWCNNYDYVSQDKMKEHPHISALVHFIFAETKGAIMLLDIQGKFAA